MTALLLSSPYSYFADANGAPLAGGLIYTYIAGTTTPQSTYTDSSAGTPLSNPVVLDSAGRATIWLSGTYKIVVKDSLGNTISTTDNIAGTGASGNMNTSVYDPALIQEQLVGLTAVQTLSNKIFTIPAVSFTPTFALATPGTSSFTYSTQTGLYMKIGSLVIAMLKLATSASSVGSGSGAIKVALGTAPASAGTINLIAGAIGIGTGFTTTQPIQINMVGGNNYAFLYNGSTNLTDSNVGATMTLNATLIYTV